MQMITEHEKRSVGAQIPEDLYWRFVKVRAERHESASKALEIAIMLYVELDTIHNTREDA